MMMGQILTVPIAIEATKESYRLLSVHHGDCEQKSSTNRPLRAELRYALADSRAHCQLWWVDVPSAVAQAFVWDVFDVAIDETTTAMVELKSIVASIPGLTLSDKPIESHWRNANDNAQPLFDCHPQRFRQMVHGAKHIAQIANQLSDTAYTSEVMHEIAGALLSPNHSRPTVLRHRITSHDKNPRAFHKMVELGMFYCEFVRTGKQIFSFPAAMVEMFRHTDVDDLPLESLQFPFPSFYVHFGAQNDLELTSGWPVDGVYVSVIENSAIQFALTAAPPSVGAYALWDSIAEPVYVQAIAADKFKIGVGLAVDEVVGAKIAELREQVQGKYELKADDLREIEADEGVQLQDVSRQAARKELANLPAQHAVWTQALKIAVNAIAYLSTYQDDIEVQWPSGTPRALLTQTDSGTWKQRQRARSKLASLGFSAIRLCGTRMMQDAQTAHADGRSRVERAATWVRGTWVHQPYGPRRALRKLRWRIPHRRGVVKAGEEVHGHIYLPVSDSGETSDVLP